MTDDNAPQWASWIIILITGLLLSAVVVAAVIISIIRNDIASIAAAIPLIAIITFSGVYQDTRRLRHAIAASMVLTYMSLLGFFFNTKVTSSLDSSNSLKELYDTFTPLVGTVIAFYFGADAYEKAAATKSGNAPPDAVQTDTALRGS